VVDKWWITQNKIFKTLSRSSFWDITHPIALLDEAIEDQPKVIHHLSTKLSTT